MVSILVNLVDWLKGWFYPKDETDALLDLKQDSLVSGENIKTINNNSILGSGNITIQGGSGGTALGCVSSFDVDTDVGDMEIYIDACDNLFVDSTNGWNSTLSDEKVPTEKLVKISLDDKVDKETGKGLSSNDFTNSYKSTMDNLKTVATTGNYADLSNKPTIPSKTSDLSNDSNFISTSNTTGLIKNDGSVDTTAYLSSLPSHNHDDRYYTESEMDTALGGKQNTLVSGSNIKTINNESILGSGNITIQGGSGSVIGTGSFTINNNGHLIVELPNSVDNPYFINNNGHLVYDTSNTYNGD